MAVVEQESWGALAVKGLGDVEWVVPYGVTEIGLRVYQAGPGPFVLGTQPPGWPRAVFGQVPVEPGQTIYFDLGYPSVDGYTGGTSGYGNGGDGAPLGIAYPGWASGGYAATGAESPWWTAIAGGIGGAGYNLDVEGNAVAYAQGHSGPWMDWNVDPPPVDEEPRTYTVGDWLGCPPTILFRNPGGPRHGGSDVGYHEHVPTSFYGGVMDSGAGGGGGFGGGCSSIYAEWTCEDRRASASLGYGGGSSGSHPNMYAATGIRPWNDGPTEGPFGTGHPGGARMYFAPVEEPACTIWAVGWLPFAPTCEGPGSG